MTMTMTAFETLKRYRINHSRKGQFSLLVTSQDAEWLTGQITAGVAGSAMDGNRKCPGDKITIRKTLILSAKESKRQN